MQLENLNSQQLRALKAEWYKEALVTNKIANLYKIGSFLGERVSANYGPKYRYSKDGLEIFVDDYGNYMTIHFNEKKVCSTHFCDQLYIPGEWELLLSDLTVLAEEKELQQWAAYEDEKARKLIQELSM